MLTSLLLSSLFVQSYNGTAGSMVLTNFSETIFKFVMLSCSRELSWDIDFLPKWSELIGGSAAALRKAYCEGVISACVSFIILPTEVFACPSGCVLMTHPDPSTQTFYSWDCCPDWSTLAFITFLLPAAAPFTLDKCTHVHIVTLVAPPSLSSPYLPPSISPSLPQSIHASWCFN